MRFASRSGSFWAVPVIALGLFCIRPGPANVASILSFVLSGVGAYLLADEVSGSPCGASWPASLSPLRLQVDPRRPPAVVDRAAGPPLALLSLRRLWRRGGFGFGGPDRLAGLHRAPGAQQRRPAPPARWRWPRDHDGRGGPRWRSPARRATPGGSASLVGGSWCFPCSRVSPDWCRSGMASPEGA